MERGCTAVWQARLVVNIIAFAIVCVLLLIRLIERELRIIFRYDLNHIFPVAAVS